MSSQTHPTLILIRGLPGSGKSTIASSLHKKLGTDQAISIDPDAVDQTSAAYTAHVKQQIAEDVDPALHLYRFLRAQAYEGIASHKIIIWNQPFSNSETLQKVLARLQDYAVSCGTVLSVLIVEVNIEPAIAQARIAQRKEQGGHGPSGDAFLRFTQEYTTFADNGYDVVSIDGSADTEAAVDTIIKNIVN